MHYRLAPSWMRYAATVFTAFLSGVDALVFTAGIGEHAAPIRAAVSEGCEWLGLHIDSEANQLGNNRISQGGSSVQGRVIPTGEEPTIARHTQRVLNHHEQGSTA